MKKLLSLSLLCLLLNACTTSHLQAPPPEPDDIPPPTDLLKRS